MPVGPSSQDGATRPFVGLVMWGSLRRLPLLQGWQDVCALSLCRPWRNSCEPSTWRRRAWRWATLRYWSQPPFLPGGQISGFTLRPSWQVFLKAGVLPRLEKQREKLVSQSLVLLQAACRGLLSRQRFQRLKVALLCGGGRAGFRTEQGPGGGGKDQQRLSGFQQSPLLSRGKLGGSSGPFLLRSRLSLVWEPPGYSAGSRLAGPLGSPPSYWWWFESFGPEVSLLSCFRFRAWLPGASRRTWPSTEPCRAGRGGS